MKVCINGKYPSSKSIAYIVPQRSCSRANIFTTSCSPIIDVVPNNIAINGFMDDHSVHKEFNHRLVDYEVHTITQELKNLNSEQQPHRDE